MFIKINQDSIRIGVISDTHGLVRPEIYHLFKDVDYIFHAGDIGNPEIIRDLERIAPVCAVIGNTDSVYNYSELSTTAFFETQNSRIVIIHDCSHLDFDPRTAGFNGVISGHTHNPLIETKNQVLYLNPGSAGPRRFELPISVAILDVTGKDLKPTLYQISS